MRKDGLKIYGNKSLINNKRDGEFGPGFYLYLTREDAEKSGLSDIEEYEFSTRRLKQRIYDMDIDWFSSVCVNLEDNDLLTDKEADVIIAPKPTNFLLSKMDDFENLAVGQEQLNIVFCNTPLIRQFIIKTDKARKALKTE